jgi:hypothetical protein
MNKIYIGLAGKKEAGKSTTAREIKRQLEALGYECEIIMFIGIVKSLMKACYGLSDEQLNSQPGKRMKLACGLTVREAIDRIGRLLRDIDGTAMVNAWKARAAASSARVIIADDVRFNAEAKAILSPGGKVFRLTRRGKTAYVSESETSLSGEYVSRVVDNRHCTPSEAAFTIISHLRLTVIGEQAEGGQ